MQKKSKLLLIFLVFFLAGFLFFVFITYDERNPPAGEIKMVECQEKYTELQIAEVFPYASESDPEKISMNDIIGFRIKFSQPLICNGRPAENVFMNQLGEPMMRTSPKLIIPSCYKNLKYKLTEGWGRNIVLVTPDGGRNVYINGAIRVIKVQ